jgi:hypothetical protein
MEQLVTYLVVLDEMCSTRPGLIVIGSRFVRALLPLPDADAPCLL